MIGPSTTWALRLIAASSSRSLQKHFVKHSDVSDLISVSDFVFARAQGLRVTAIRSYDDGRPGAVLRPLGRFAAHARAALIDDVLCFEDPICP